MSNWLLKNQIRHPASGSGEFPATWIVDSLGPIRMGVIAAPGQITVGRGVQVGTFPTQTDWLNTYADGSLRHGTASFIATSTGPKELTTIPNPGGSYTPTWPTATTAVFVVTAGPGAGNTYTATLPAFNGTHTTANGAIERCAWAVVVPVTGGSTPHPTLQVIVEVTSYVGSGQEVDFIVQNVQNVAAMAAVTYTVTLNVSGGAVFTNGGASHKHFTGTMWHYSAWTGATEAVVHHDFTTWKQAKVIPTIVAADAVTYDFTGTNYKMGAGEGSGGAYFGEMNRDQITSGSTDRLDIQHINEWDAVLFANNTENARDASLKNGDMGTEWSWGITDTDGIGIPKVTDAAWTAVVSDFNAIGTGAPGAPCGLGLWTYDASGYYFAGGRIGGNADVNPTNVNNEHMPEMEFIPYLLTGKFFYLHALRLHAAWAVLIGGTGWTESDPRFFPGLMVGRNGTQGIVSSTGVTREFATPLKNVLHAAWAMPDAHADHSYFITIAQNNLNYLGYYTNYWITNNMGGALEGFGYGDYIPHRFLRSNTVASTATGNPTILTVKGDDSGIGTGTNDHGAATGDFAALTGFVTSGATALNNTHVLITRIDATHFSVPINTTATTTGEGTYTFVTGLAMPAWRLWFTSYQADWALRTGIFSVDATVLDFVNRCGRLAIKMSAGINDTDYYTNHKSGMAFGWYQSYGYVTGDTLVWYSTMDQLRADHANLTSNTARLFESQGTYAGAGGGGQPYSTTHRGNWTGWNENEAELQNHNHHADAMLVIAANRGLTGATTELARRRAVTGHTADMSAHAGMYFSFDY